MGLHGQITLVITPKPNSPQGESQCILGTKGSDQSYDKNSVSLYLTWSFPNLFGHRTIYLFINLLIRILRIPFMGYQFGKSCTVTKVLISAEKRDLSHKE